MTINPVSFNLAFGMSINQIKDRARQMPDSSKIIGCIDNITGTSITGIRIGVDDLLEIGENNSEQRNGIFGIITDLASSSDIKNHFYGDSIQEVLSDAVKKLDIEG